MRFQPLIFSSLLFLSPLAAVADGLEDNNPATVRPVPPPGIALTEADEARLREKLGELEGRIETLRAAAEKNEVIRRYLPDVEICYKAVHDALVYGEFFKEAEVGFAMDHLTMGLERAAQLAAGEAPWTRQSGPVLRAYHSRIDGSVQPYGLEIPETYDFGHPVPVRLDLWFHGRGETLSEVSFLQQRITGKGGKISPSRTIVLHPYGRYSNANRFAGEIDVLEALEHAKGDYQIDPHRILARGFSMGGASAWQFATHFPGEWAAASPGAGFSETADFLKTFQGETLTPTWWEQKLWRWYDATEWVENLSQLPTIAYSGEKDRQKQAADMMVAAAEKVGLDLVHLIGPDTEHQIHPDSLVEIESRLASIVDAASNRTPENLRFVTYTLRYHRHHWLQVDGLEEHWEKSSISAKRIGSNEIEIQTDGITAFSLHFGPGESWINPLEKPRLIVDGDSLEVSPVRSDFSWNVSLSKSEQGGWKAEEGPARLRKKNGLQGPIDDAFMDSFLVVSPTGKPQFDLVGEWTAAEKSRALVHWRKQFRGEARHKPASEVTDEDIAAHHLILWGDPSSQPLLSRVLADLPVKWTSEFIEVGSKRYDAAHHTLAMIYPNPLNPERYLVLNSGFTYREYDYLNNARQSPKLPDWAVIDLREPPTSRFPGKIVEAGFFDEAWQIKPYVIPDPQ